MGEPMPTPAGLPPMPDRQTGEPRPPSAPLADGGRGKPDPKLPYRARKVLLPPADEGPPLEWDYGDRSMFLWWAGIAVVLLIALFTFRNMSLEWVTDWRRWLAIALLASLFALLSRGHKISAGADWYNARGGFVKTYELTKVKVRGGGGGDPVIELTDRHGGEASSNLGSIQINRELWDLVYNGICHSVVNGAEVNDLAVRWLKLRDVVRLRDQAQNNQ